MTGATGGRRPTRMVAVLVGRSPEERYSIHRGYVDALLAVDAQPLIVPAGEGADPERVVDLVLRCDALLVSGGGDVDPRRYGARRGPADKDVDPDRDLVELAAVRCAQHAGRPVLGICRGAQLLAVADGGTLVTDLLEAGFPGHWDEERHDEPVHDLTADDGSLARRFLAGATGVNSIHHQAVQTPGASLRPTAWSADGVTEAIEGDGTVGLQWHPERLAAHDARHLAPFRWLVSA